MATQNPISTISYNSVKFLKEKLDTWYQSHIISCYMFIRHKGEDGDKDHTHVFLIPNRRLDPMDLVEELKEYTADNPKPLGVRPFRKSKEEDWILYAVHDPDYLKIKYSDDPREKIPYKWENIVSSDGFDVETAFIRARSHLKHTSANLVGRLKSGTSAMTLLSEGENPMMVNAIIRGMSMTEFERLQSDYNDLLGKFEELKGQYDVLDNFLDQIKAALDEAGLNVVYDVDRVHLEPSNEVRH